MAYLYRLIASLVLVLLSGSVGATIPKASLWSTDYLLPTKSDSFVGACQAHVAKYLAQYPTSGAAFGSATPTRCYWKPAPATNYVNINEYPASGCPANSTASGSGCACGSGYVELGGTSCIIDNGCTSVLGLTPPNSGACVGGNCQYGYKVSAGEQATAQPFGRFCNSGCTVKGELNFCGQYSSGVMIAGQGVCEIKNSYYTGDKCTGSGAVSGPSSQGTTGGTTTDPTAVNTEANPVPARLDPGKCPGQINGVDIPGGVNCGSTAGNDTTVKNGTTVNPDGTVTNNNTTNNTTIKNTICNAGACTTTTTVTSGGSGPNGTGAGSTTTTTTESGPKAEVCSKNPGISACQGDDDKKPTGFGGSCAGGYKAVSEDAVINAMAEETYRQNCKVNPDDASQTLGREEAAKTGNQTGSNPNNGSVSIGAGSFDSSNALGGVASCIADKTIVVMGKSVNIAFSMICQYLEALGLVMLGVASLLALRIVTRG